jgi:hypothetical protein
MRTSWLTGTQHAMTAEVRWKAAPWNDGSLGPLRRFNPVSVQELSAGKGAKLPR